ncbi:MAG: hypothetical protein ACYS9X_07915 [Planctomycetota bacterium]|jgi:tetratricopeptide (TPR) repeat protein
MRLTLLAPLLIVAASCGPIVGEDAGATRAERRLARRAGQLLSKAWRHYMKGELESALATANTALEGGASGNTRAQLLVRIGDTYQAMGEYDHMVEAYRAAISLGPGDERAGQPRAANDAFRMLALYHERAGRWSEAHGMWLEWSAASFCGNCWASRTDRRTYHIGLCLWKMGRPDDALRFLEEAEVTRDRSLLSWHNSRCLYIDLLRRSLSLDEIETRLGGDPTQPFSGGLWESDISSYVYLKALRLAEAGDVEALWREVRSSACMLYPISKSPHPAAAFADPTYVMSSFRAASEALVSLKEKSRPVLLDAARQGGASEHLAAVALLGKMRAEEVLPMARDRFPPERRPEYAEVYCAALADLGTDEAMALLRQWATSDVAPLKWAARKALANRALEDAARAKE